MNIRLHTYWNLQLGLCPKPKILFCLNTKKDSKKSQGCVRFARKTSDRQL